MRLSHMALVAASVLVAVPVLAAPRLGQAVVVNQRGKAEYEDPHGTVEDIKEGVALFHGHIMRTKRDGSLRSILTPGAMICLAPDTEIVIDRLEMVTDGLPGDQKVITKDIKLTIRRGDMRVHMGELAKNTRFEVVTPVGSVVATNGQFIIGGKNSDWHLENEEGPVSFEADGRSVAVESGDLLTAKRKSGGKVDISTGPAADRRLYKSFHACREASYQAEPVLVDIDYIGEGDIRSLTGDRFSLTYIGEPTVWYDVSPSIRYSTPPTPMTVTGAKPGEPAGPGAGRWDRIDIWSWYDGAGTLKGFNYVPRTAINSTEMWQEESFDLNTIDEELSWAAGSGHNAVRVFLPYIVWAADPDGFKERLAQFLEEASAYDLKTVFALFDDNRPTGKDPKLGPQGEPVPGIHNSGWTPSPGHALAQDPSMYPQLEEYVKDIVGKFGDDRRVLMWDLYSDAGRSGMGSKSMPLLERAFGWAREMKPRQPLTAALWVEMKQDDAKRVLDLSDVVSLSAYDTPVNVEDRVLLAKTIGRPVICTEWLRRETGNDFKNVLPIFSFHGVGWFHWGLVEGKTQTYYPWTSKQGAAKPEIWEQDILREDGSAYDEEEIRMIKGFEFD